MAFDYTKFERWSASVAPGINSQWAYTDSLSTIAQVTTAGFFDSINDIAADGLSAGNAIIKTGDIIWVVASDQNTYILVTDTLPTITSSVFDVVLGAGAVGTANIANLAVTGAKMANDTITDTQVQDNGLSSLSLAKNTIQYAQVAMTAAEWNGMYAAPKLILAAPGAGLIYQVDNVWYDMVFVAAQYAAGGVVNLQFDSTVNGAGVLATQDTAAATITGLAASSIVRPANGITAIAQSTTVNKGLYMSNKTGAFTTGDGTWKINVAYRILTA